MASLQWGDLLERLARFRFDPIRLELRPMKDRPLANQLQRRFRLNVADDHLTAEVELALLPLVLSVEMCRFVFFVVHPPMMPKKIEMMGTAAVYRRQRESCPRLSAGLVNFDPRVGCSAL